MPIRSAARAALLAALALALAACAGGAEEVRLESVRLRTGSMPPVPPVGERVDTAALDALGGWQPVTIPDAWGLRRRARALEGWYRADLVLPPGHRDWALHLDGAWQNLAVFANGERIAALARGGPTPLGQPVWSATLLAPIPDHVERLPLLIHYRTAPAEIGAVIEAVAGPRTALESRIRTRQLLRSSIPAALALVGVACGLIALVLARYASERGVYWFALATTSWCLFSVIPTDPDSAWGWLASAVSHAFVPAIAIGFHRLLGLARPRLEYGIAALFALFALLRALATPVLIPAVDVVWWMANFFLGLYLLPLALETHRRRATNGSIWLVVAGFVLVVAGLHDVASIAAQRMILAPFSLFAAASPVVGVATALTILASLVDSLRHARALNTELEDRVEEKRRELAASWARTAELERERAIAAERERMMRDMHDGTGGQLVSALSLVESGEFRPEDLAETLRAALADLRLSIDSLESGPADLLALLALARARLEPRLEHHGVRFAWQVEDVPTPASFGPEESLHLLRIFQEAITNAIKHAKARVIAVRTRVADAADGRAVVVEIADDGRGLDAPTDAPGSGRGLRNMRRRAEEMHGRLEVHSGAGGTTVSLAIPLEAPATPPPS